MKNYLPRRSEVYRNGCVKPCVETRMKSIWHCDDSLPWILNYPGNFNAVSLQNRRINALCESCENEVWSGQLWLINSPPIFNEKEPNFQWWCKNIQIFEKVIRFLNVTDKKWWKKQKTCWGCCHKISLVSKKSSKKNGFVLENALFVTRPPSTKKTGFKSEIIKF